MSFLKQQISHASDLNHIESGPYGQGEIRRIFASKGLEFPYEPCQAIGFSHIGPLIIKLNTQKIPVTDNHISFAYILAHSIIGDNSTRMIAMTSLQNARLFTKDEYRFIDEVVQIIYAHNKNGEISNEYEDEVNRGYPVLGSFRFLPSGGKSDFEKNFAFRTDINKLGFVLPVDEFSTLHQTLLMTGNRDIRTPISPVRNSITLWRKGKSDVQPQITNGKEIEYRALASLGLTNFVSQRKK